MLCAAADEAQTLMTIAFPISDSAYIQCNPLLPTESIAAFDDVQVKLVTGTQEYVLYHDFAIEAARPLCSVLTSLIQGSCDLIDELRSVGIGHWWNHYLASGTGPRPQSSNLVARYNVWELDYDTWMYSADSVAYIEVTPTYVWAFLDEDTPGYVPFDEFMSNYAAIAKFVVTPSALHEWHETCVKWLRSMEAMMEEGHYQTSEEHS
jgi:hypothetical protein